VDLFVSAFIFVLATYTVGGFPHSRLLPRSLPMSDSISSAHGPIVETHGIHGGQEENHHGAHGHDVHVTPTRHYIYVFLALCFLTTLSFCTYFDWWRSIFTPAESRMLMMAVSCSKALLVILFFMHILWEANWKYVLTIPAAIMSMFLILMLIPDVGNRMRHQSDERKFNAAEPRMEKPAPAARPSPVTTT
jgi:cytochrome c oxidase subunit 4